MIYDNAILTAAQKLDIISKNSAEGVIIINDSGCIEEWNDYMASKTGYSKMEITGRKIWDVQYQILTDPWQKKYSLELLKKIWMNFINDLRENECVAKEGQFLARNKEIILTEDIICRINLQNKRYLYVIQRDRRIRKITAHEEVMFKIISLQLESLSSSLLDFSELFNKEKRSLNIDNLLNLLSGVISSSEHTIKFLDNLLVFLSYQKGSLNFEPVKTNLNPIIENVIGEYKSTASSKNIELCHQQAAEIYCTADINALNIILCNLVENALKFTNENGRVEISAVINRDSVEIMITDNGLGIDNETMNNLFVADSNVPAIGTRGEQGCGLGLILSRNLVERHGGKIWVESVINKGSKFIFTVPAG